MVQTLWAEQTECRTNRRTQSRSSRKRRASVNHIEVNVAAFVKSKDVWAAGPIRDHDGESGVGENSLRNGCTSSVKDGVSLVHAAPRQRKMDHFEGWIRKSGDELLVIPLLDVPNVILNENGEANRFTTASFLVGFNHTNFVASQAVPEQRDGENVEQASQRLLRMSNRKWNQVCIRSNTLRCHPARQRCRRSSQTVPESRQEAQQQRLWRCMPSRQWPQPCIHLRGRHLDSIRPNRSSHCRCHQTLRFRSFHFRHCCMLGSLRQARGQRGRAQR